MKVISEPCTLALLESLRLNLDHAVKMLEISLDHNEAIEWDLRIAKANLEQLERLITYVKKESFNASEIYYPKEKAI